MMTDDTAYVPPMSKGQDFMIDFALDTPGCAWFAPPGFGKTRAAMEVIASTEGRTLVVAPKLVCLDTWPRENEKWGYGFHLRFLHGKQRHLRGRERVSLINYEALPWLAEMILRHPGCPWEMVIFDELSKMKGYETARVQDFLKVLPRFKYRLGMTGTPVGVHLKDLFSEMLVCDGGHCLGDDHSQFMRRYFRVNPYSHKIEPYSDTEQLLIEAIKPRAVSFDINDLDLPPLNHLPTRLELPEDARIDYEQMQKDFVLEKEGDDGAAIEVYAANAAVKSSKLRQMTGGGVIDVRGDRHALHDAKAEALKQILDEHDGRPVMVFFQFASDYHAICRMLKREPGQVPALFGGTKAADVPKIIKRWNAGKIPVLCLHPRSASYGINLQDSGNVVVWYTLDWSIEMVLQGIGRLWRQGQKQKVLCYYLLVADTEDEVVFERVTERKGLHDRVMDALLYDRKAG
jgi:Helicase conserved C-terminal domain/SNF2-related domain